MLSGIKTQKYHAQSEGPPQFQVGGGSNQATNSNSFQPQQQPKWGEATSKPLMLIPHNKAMDHTKGGLTLMPKGTGRINKPMFLLHL